MLRERCKLLQKRFFGGGLCIVIAMAAVVLSSTVPMSAGIIVGSPGLHIDPYSLDNVAGGSDNIARWNLSVYEQSVDADLDNVNLSLNSTDPYYAPNISKLSNYTFSENDFSLLGGQNNATNVTLTLIINPGTVAGDYNIKVDVAGRAGPVWANTSSICYVNVTETIVAPTVIYPNGGEVIAGGSVSTIQWELPGLTNENIITIYYSTDNGSSWSEIATDEANDGVYSWSVPNIGSSDCRVKVEAEKDLIYFANDTSNSTFTITYTSPPPTPPPVAVPEFNVVGLLALIGILSMVLAFAAPRRKR